MVHRHPVRRCVHAEQHASGALQYHANFDRRQHGRCHGGWYAVCAVMTGIETLPVVQKILHLGLFERADLHRRGAVARQSHVVLCHGRCIFADFSHFAVFYEKTRGGVNYSDAN